MKYYKLMLTLNLTLSPTTEGGTRSQAAKGQTTHGIIVRVVNEKEAVLRIKPRQRRRLRSRLGCMSTGRDTI